MIDYSHPIRCEYFPSQAILQHANPSFFVSTVNQATQIAELVCEVVLEI